MEPSAWGSYGDTCGRTASVDPYCHQRTGLLAALLSDFLVTSKGKPVAMPVSPSAMPGITSKPGFPGRTLNLCFWRWKKNCRRLIKKREKQLKRSMGSHTACHNLCLSHLAAGLSSKLLVQQLEIAFLQGFLSSPSCVLLEGSHQGSGAVGRSVSAWWAGSKNHVSSQKVVNSGTGRLGTTSPWSTVYLLGGEPVTEKWRLGAPLRKAHTWCFMHQLALTWQETFMAVLSSRCKWHMQFQGGTWAKSWVKSRYPGNPPPPPSVCKCPSPLSSERKGKKKAIFMRAVNSRQAGWAWINLFSHSCLDKVSCHWKHNRNSQLLFQEAEIAVPWAFWSTVVAAGLAGISCALTLHWPCLITSSALFKAKYVFLLSPKWRTGADAYQPFSCDQMQIGAFCSCDQEI